MNEVPRAKNNDGNAPKPALRGVDAQTHAVPVARNAEWPLPDARWQEHGTAHTGGEERSRMASWKHGQRSRVYTDARREANQAMRLLRRVVAKL